MAKVPITIYLSAAQLAKIEHQAQVVGESRSAWVSQTLLRALEGELEPFDEILLDQLIKVRANQEQVLKLVAKVAKSTSLQDVQKASRDMAERMLFEAKSRIGK